MEIELDEQERAILEDLVDSEIGDIREEIHHAESADMIEAFRVREVIAKGLKAKLEGKPLEEPVVT